MKICTRLTCLLSLLFAFAGTALAQEAKAPLTSLVPFEDPESLLWGYRDSQSGEILIEAQYIMAGDFEHAVSVVVDKEGWAYIHPNGEIILRPYIFDNGPDYYEEGLARFVEKGKVGFNNKSLEKVIPARFDYINPFVQGRAAFCVGCEKQMSGEYFTMVGGRWGYIDVNGVEVIPPVFEAVNSFEQDRAQVKIGANFMEIDSKGVFLSLNGEALGFGFGPLSWSPERVEDGACETTLRFVNPKLTASLEVVHFKGQCKREQSVENELKYQRSQMYEFVEVPADEGSPTNTVRGTLGSSRQLMDSLIVDGDEKVLWRLEWPIDEAIPGVWDELERSFFVQTNQAAQR